MPILSDGVVSKETKEQWPSVPNPGSDEALQAGCRCPVMDNGHGAGYMGQAGIFVMNLDCPLHGFGENE